MSIVSKNNIHIYWLNRFQLFDVNLKHTLQIYIKELRSSFL